MKRLKLRNSKERDVFVDDEDYEYLKQWEWQELSNRGYAIRHGYNISGKRIMIYIHKEILKDAQNDLEIDHINGNKLDNRKENLRLCTHKQNCANRPKVKKTGSRFKGVCWNEERKKWLATITVNRKSIHIGRFKTEIEAANAYNEKAISFFGEFARLNDLVSV